MSVHGEGSAIAPMRGMASLHLLADSRCSKRSLRPACSSPRWPASRNSSCSGSRLTREAGASGVRTGRGSGQARIAARPGIRLRRRRSARNRSAGLTGVADRHLMENIAPFVDWLDFNRRVSREEPDGAAFVRRWRITSLGRAVARCHRDRGVRVSPCSAAGEQETSLCGRVPLDTSDEATTILLRPSGYGGQG